MTSHLSLVILALAGNPIATQADRWFPLQAAPKGLARTVAEDRLPEPRPAYRMLVQSVAGLAAGAVNANHCDEMVWVTTGYAYIDRWGAAMLGRTGATVLRETFSPW